jgi:hypothetical protein
MKDEGIYLTSAVDLCTIYNIPQYPTSVELTPSPPDPQQKNSSDRPIHETGRLALVSDAVIITVISIINVPVTLHYGFKTGSVFVF